MSPFSKPLYALLFALFCTNAYTQCINIGATPLEDASINSDNEYIITPATGNQVGAFWGISNLDLNQGFDFEFRIFLGDRNDGADGVAFVIRGIGTSDFGSSGGGVGYQNINPSFAVEFDTFNNGGSKGDISDDHTGIQINGESNHNVSSANLFGPQSLGTGGDIEDGAYHDVQFIWDPSANTFTYYFDGTLLTTTSVDLRTVIGADQGIWGFTGSTGGFFNEQKICALTQIGDPPPLPTDLDKDNDGITNAVECGGGCAEPLSNGGFENPVIPASNFSFEQAFREGVDNFDTHDLKWSTTSSDNTIELWSDGFLGVNAFEGNQFAELNATEVATLFQSLCITPGSVVSWSVRHRGRDGVDVAEVRIGETLATAVTQATMSDGNTDWGLYTGQYTVPAAQQSTIFAFVSISSSGNSASGNFIDDVQISIISSPPCPDLDGDGIPNDEDPDSDGDGCTDAAEAGYPDPDQTGHPDSLVSNQVTQDGDGLVTNSTTINANGGYITPRDANNDGIPDFLQATSITFTQALSNLVVNENEVATFTFETDHPNPTILWEESIDGGGNWTTLSDTGIYSGTTTNTLSIDPATIDLNGNLYRVTLSDPNFACNALLTSPAQLSVVINIFVPDGFSPNGDGINDTFEILDLANFPNYVIKIYNRYGNKVFEGNANLPFWDGTPSSTSLLSGDTVPSGVYFYIIDLQQDGYDPLQGRIHVRK